MLFSNTNICNIFLAFKSMLNAKLIFLELFFKQRWKRRSVVSVVAYIDTYIFTKEYEKCTESRNIANALRSNSYLTLILFRLHNYLISYLATGNVIYLFLHSLIWFNFLFQVTIVSLTVGEHYYKLSLRKMSSEFIIADHSFF